MQGQEEFVSHPIRSLAQAYVYREQCQPFGIYHEGRMVGYVMVIYDYDIGDSNRVALTCNKKNPIALKLYESKGFSATGNEYDDEIELAMLV